uniref:DDE Tnp4 domain-containing protein n=1 Tax=Macrostomum lignano TaxID=282301 RepID=A0A1I8JC51_9PLAT
MRRLACSIGSICSLHLVISWAVLANAGDNSPKQLAAVTICDGRRLWKLANQRVSVLNPWWGGVSAAVAFKEFFRLGSTDMIRWRRLDGSRSCERFGHIDILVDSTEYRVVDGSEFHVEYDDLGSQGNMAGHLRLGKNIFSLGPLEYEYTAVLDSWCKNFTSLSPWKPSLWDESGHGSVRPAALFAACSWDMIRRNCIKNSHYHVHGGWVKAFSSSQEFYVLGGSEIIFNMVTGFKVDDNYSEMFEAKLGLTIVQRDFFRYELILLDAGFCRPG